jgi:DNA processing protein
LCAGTESRRFRRVRQRHEQEFLDPDTLRKQGDKLVATWKDVWEELPTEIGLTMTPASSPESSGASPASLFPDEGLPPHEKRILSLLKADESTHIDTMIERFGTGMSSSEIFAALFELELTSKVKQMPRKNFVKRFQCLGERVA